MNLRAKLARRIHAPLRAYAERLKALVVRLGRIYPGAKEAAEREIRSTNGARQWHRWHKVNSRRQRQMSALKQSGMKIHPNDTGLKRHMVK